MGRLISRILFLVALIIGGVCLILYTMSTTLGEITVKGEQYVRLDQFDVNNYTVDLVWKDGHTDTYKLSELPDEYSVYYDGVLLGGDNLYVEAAVGAHVLEVKFDDYVGKLDHTVTYGYFTSVDMIVTNDAGEVVPYDEMSKTYSISYDGKAHSFEFLNCPDGVSIEYYAEVFNSVTRTYEEFDGTQFTDAGKYKLTATLSHPGYDDKDQNRVQTKFLEIGKKQISVSVDSQSFAFTGNIVTKDINGKEVAKPKFNGVIGNYVPNYTINYYDANKIKVAPDALSEIGTYSVKIESTDSNYAFSYEKKAVIDIAKYHTISFVQSGAEFDPILVKEGSKISDIKNIPSAKAIPEGYKFLVTDKSTPGKDVWDWKNSAYDEAKGVTESFSVKAQFVPIEYTIECTYYGGSFTVKYDIESGVAALPVPEGSEYFKGWYNGKDEQIESIAVGTIGNISLTAKYGFSYSVVVNGEEVANEVEGYSTKLEINLAPVDRSAEGYQFIGWTVKDGDAVKAVNMPYSVAKEGLVFTPNYEAKIYNVYFIGNKSDKVTVLPTVPAATTYTVESPLILNSENGIDYDEKYIPSLACHEFVGWSENKSDATGSFVNTTGKVGDIYLYACWDVGSVTIIFNPNSDATDITNMPGENGNVSCDYFDSFSLTVAPKRPGYEFVGWSTDPNADKSGVEEGESKKVEVDFVDGTVYYAVWQIKEFTVIFADGQGGSNAKPGITTGYMVLPENSIARDGYTFAGWKVKGKDEGVFAPGYEYYVTEAITFEAQWTANDNTIVFDPNEADDISNPVANIVEKTGMYITIPGCTYTKEFYKFVSWNTEPDGTGTPYKAGARYKIEGTKTNGATLYAQWELVDHSVKFENCTGIPSQSITHGKNVTLKAPTKDGYDFAGWTIKGDSTATVYKSGHEYTVRADTVFVANWTARKNTVTFNANGATDISVPVEDITGVNTDTEITLPECTFKKDYYEFAGWTYGGKTYKPGDKLVVPGTANDTIDVKAAWSAVEYTVSFGFVGLDSNEYPAVSVKISYANLKDGAYTLKYSDLKLTKDIGYIFGGFYSDAECKTGISNVTVDPTGAKRYVTVYAEVCEAIAGISYIPNGDGYAISRYNGYATVVNLPTHYNNLEVNAITGSGTLGAFMYKSVEAVIFAENNNIERIGSNAFAGCNNLTKIVISDGVTQIDEYAFAMCENLETVVISDTVTKMGEKVFYECKSLSAIYCESAEASLGWDAKWNVIYDDGTKVSAVYFGGSWEYDSNGNPKKKA